MKDEGKGREEESGDIGSGKRDNVSVFPAVLGLVGEKGCERDMNGAKYLQ